MPGPKLPMPTGSKLSNPKGWMRGDDVTAVVPHVIPEADEGYRPSRPQIRAKTAYWLLVRDDPTRARVGETDPEAISAAVRDPRVVKWWKDPDFPPWFLDQHEDFQKVEYFFHLGMDELTRRMPTMQDRELIAAMKLAAELGRKLPDKFGPKSQTGGVPELEGKSEAELRQFLITAAGSLGLQLVEAPAPAKS